MLARKAFASSMLVGCMVVGLAVILRSQARGDSDGAPADRTPERNGIRAEYKGDCGLPLVIRTDGSQCPGLSAGGTNTCNQNNSTSDRPILITSCSTVMNYDARFAGHHNLSSPPGCDTPGNPACTTDTGWFVTLVECCTGGDLGAGVPWGETKSCCQVMPGQSPASCDTPCGQGGKKGCATCLGPSAGQCTNTFGPVQKDHCSDGDKHDDCSDANRYWERIRVQDDGDNACHDEREP